LPRTSRRARQVATCLSPISMSASGRTQIGHVTVSAPPIVHGVPGRAGARIFSHVLIPRKPCLARPVRRQFASARAQPRRAHPPIDQPRERAWLERVQGSAHAQAFPCPLSLCRPQDGRNIRVASMISSVDLIQ
jgi:hypothetical protein